MHNSERDAWLLIGLLPGLGSVLTRRCIAFFGSPEKVLSAGPAGLARVEGITQKKAADIFDAIHRLDGSDALKREIDAFERMGARLVVLGSPGYPRPLAAIHDPPVVLYVRGELHEQDAVSVGIVGARRCSRYGMEQADRFSSLLAQSGLVIVSGGAMGIDTAAHRATLRVKGRTIAVLGSGLARPYPAENASMFDEIVRNGGTVVSELPMTAPPMRENFPSRNRIIAGLSLGVVVIEAEERSGALITARLSAEDYNRQAMAVPGPVDSATSAGCHKMIREGWGTLVTRHTDVLDALGETGTILRAVFDESESKKSQEALDDSGMMLFGAGGSLLSMADPLEKGLTASQGKIVQALDQPRMLEQIAAITGLPIQTIQADLTLLEIRGLVQKQGTQFSRRRKRG